MGKDKTIDKQPVECIEESVPFNRVVELLKSNVIEDLIYNRERPSEDWRVQDFMTLLEFFQNNGKVKRYYKYAKSDEKNEQRLYTVDGLGLQLLKSELRGYLCQDDYLDIDISNCHPTIIHEMMKEDNEECDLLNDYLINKDKWRRQYDNIKELIIQQINDSNTLRKTPWDIPNKLLKSIYLFVKRHGKIYDILAKKENEILSKIRAIAKENDIIVNSLVFDGLIIKKSHNTDEFIKKVNASIQPYVIMIKPWKIPNIKILDTQRFHYNDKTTFLDLLKLSGNHYPTIIHFYMDGLPLLLKTLRVVGDSLITKSDLSDIKDSFEIHKNIKKDTFSVTVGNKHKKVYITDIISQFSKLITFGTVTPLKNTKNQNEFSTDSGFLCEHDELPSDWQDRIIKFKNHILEVNSCGDETIARGFYHFFANIIQTEKKSQVIMVTTGLQGIGKSIIPTMIATKILGSKALIVSTLADITGKFNSHLANKRMVLVNEMSNLDSNHKHTDNDVLKNIVDAPYFLMEPKGVDKIKVPNILEFFGCSNYKYCISQSDGMERRNFVIQANDKYKDNHEYFNDLVAYLENSKNIRSIYEFLKTYDIIENKVLTNLPTTESKATGIFKSMHPVLKAILIALKQNDLDNQEPKNEVRITRQELYDILIKYHLINNDFGKNKLTDHIRDHLSNKIKIVNPKNILTYVISPSNFKYDSKIWNIIKSYIEEKDDE